MEFNSPINGEYDPQEFGEPIEGELDLDDDQLADAAEAMMDAMRQMIALQQQTLQVMSILAQQMAVSVGPKRVVRDQGGKVIGVEPV